VLTFLADLTPASAVLLSASGYAALSVPVLLFPGTALADFDPRPAVRRALETGRLEPMWQAAIHAGHDVNRAYATGQRVGHHAAGRAKHVPRDAAVSVAALLMLLSAPPKGHLR